MEHSDVYVTWDLLPAAEQLPATFIGPGTLTLMTPHPLALGAIQRLAADLGVPFDCPFDDVVSLRVTERIISTFLDRLAEALTPSQCESTRALFQPVDAPLGLRSLLSVDRLTTVIRRWRATWLVDMLRRNGLVTHFQPIVRSDDPTNVYGHEALTRGVGEDRELVPPLKLYEAAVAGNILAQLDRAARLTAIGSATRHRLAGKIFINFLPSAIYSPECYLQSTLAALRSRDLTPDRIVLEVVETERIRDVEELRRTLEIYRAHGFGVALDDLGSGFGSLSIMHALRPDYVKIDQSLVRYVTTDPYKATIAANLLQTARALGVPSIAEGIETEEEWRWFRDKGAIFQQGFLFAEPATPPPPVAGPRRLAHTPRGRRAIRRPAHTPDIASSPIEP